MKDTDKIDRDFIPYLLSNDDNIELYLKNKQMKHKWKRISEALQSSFIIYPTCVKGRVIELE